MAKLTIAELQRQLSEKNKMLNEQIEINLQLMKENEQLRSNPDERGSREIQFLRSQLEEKELFVKTLKGQLQWKSDTIQRLESEIDGLKKQLDNNPPRSHNERGAGRKPIWTEQEREHILRLRDSGLSVRKISKEVGLSIGTVQKLINEHMGNSSEK